MQLVRTNAFSKRVQMSLYTIAASVRARRGETVADRVIGTNLDVAE